ncbi:MAG: ParA family protein [Deltaproteobacteria bacterium]|jgi:chromosome partitioning protein|nr:ParA family protein [Deltaproteobacteria bacterium]
MEKSELGAAMQVLAIANQKGGVGKTTTAVTLAAALARRGKRVLLLDLDPHANASVHLRVYPESQKFSCYDLFISEPESWADLWGKVRVGLEGSFDLVPASIRLSELEVDLSKRQGKGVLLKLALKLVEREYDYALLDCPPHVGILLVNALVASDLLIIPIQTDFLALHGLKLLFDTVNLLNKVLPSPIRYKALATMFDRRTKASQRVLELMQAKMPENMFRSVIGVDTRFRDASAQGKVIYELGLETRGGREYDEVASELLSHE